MFKLKLSSTFIYSSRYRKTATPQLFSWRITDSSKRRTLQDEQVKEIIDQLIRQITRHQKTLNELRDLPLQIPNSTSQQTQNFAVKFDSLEMDVYTEFHTTLHEAIEEILQLQETTESLELLVTQAAQISDKQENLTLNIIESLVEARMLPLGNILNRFQMVNKLGNVYAKLVELKLTGTEVLVDKAIAENSTIRYYI